MSLRRTNLVLRLLIRLVASSGPPIRGILMHTERKMGRLIAHFRVTKNFANVKTLDVSPGLVGK
jgi:hypothetical protein